MSWPVQHILRLGAVLFALGCLYPPWVQTVHRGQIQGSEPLGYAWVFRPPKPKIKSEPAATSFDRNFDPDKPKQRIHPSWNDLPETVLSKLPDDPRPPNEDSFATDGIAVSVDLARLLIEVVALGALVGIGVTFVRKRPA